MIGGENPQTICDNLFKDMIGNNIKFDSPIKNEKGEPMKKYLIYNDFTASGKGLKSIERFIEHQVLPNYANVHSTVGHCAEITSKYLHEAKNILRNYTNAYGNYSIIFHGQGATGGVHKLIEVLSIKKYESFYNNLETANNILQIFGDETVEVLGEGLIKKIKAQFKELFIDINFCFKFKENNTYKTKCILCNVELVNEGDYHRHIKGEIHKNILRQYEQNPDKQLFEIHEHSISDFLDIIRRNYNIDRKESLIKLIKDYKKFKPVVFYSLYEHNSNSLSWKETQCEIVQIEVDYEIFYDVLKAELEKYKDNYIKIGSFTASSNITGLLLDVDKIASIMHEANGFAFFDYAAAAPYLQIDVNNPLPDDYRQLLGFCKLTNEEKKRTFKDGMFFSPHKFIGGPNTPGVLITHDRIYRNQLKPTQPGGGTVNYVYTNFIDYIQDVELKEESGTPNIIGGIRLGLMTSIRQKIPHRFIIEKDEYYINLFLKELENIPNIYILHDKLLKNKVHVPVFSFMISFGDKFLHPNYICALLNDLFGIQSRPGCSCAPNYGRFLLGYNKVENDYQILESLIIEGFEIFRPGYLRLNLPYFYPQFIIEYVIKAIKFICQNGHLLLGLYYYDITSGKFWHYGNQGISQTLNFFDFSSNSIGKEDLYRPPNLNVVSSKDLDKIYDEVERYVSSYNFLKKTFFLRNNEPITRRNDYQRFGEKEKSRWFCVFKDVEPLLKKLNLLVVNSMDENSDNEYKKLIEDFEAKTRQKKRDWAIQYQNVDLRRSTVIY
jgi:selenocysteine lyase/cysteine desulfurase